MTRDMKVEKEPTSEQETVEKELIQFLGERFKTSVAADQDLFVSGLVSSLAAMELVVHLEGAYSVAVLGEDLRLENFRTAKSMAELVLRLKDR
jgi:methoxymalonate biosynthesis acyl carrier protein